MFCFECFFLFVVQIYRRHPCESGFYLAIDLVEIDHCNEIRADTYECAPLMFGNDIQKPVLQQPTVTLVWK